MKFEVKNGAPTRTRTADLLITNQLLYQLSYRGAAGELAILGAACKIENASNAQFLRLVCAGHWPRAPTGHRGTSFDL